MDSRIEIVEGDITTWEVDAIVNAANERLTDGGGVNGAIHRAAGPGLDQECRRIGGCPTGEARITAGHRLHARWVIHAVGPVWRGGEGREDELLDACYRASLRLAVQHGARTVAFPIISAGIFGYPFGRAVRIALTAIDDFLVAEGDSLQRVLVVAFGVEAHRKCLAVSQSLGRQSNLA